MLGFVEEPQHFLFQKIQKAKAPKIAYGAFAF